MPLDSASPDRADRLASLLAQQPPRRVPADLAKAAHRQLAAPLSLAIFGLFFGAFGLLGVAKLFPWHLLRDWQLADAAVAPGRVTAAVWTRVTINRQRVYRYDFQFNLPDGSIRTGASFTTGQQWSVGNAVRVEYAPGDPALCRIAGSRLSVGSGGSAFVLIFPGVGGALIAWVVASRLRVMRLLRDGELAEAKVLAVDPTAVRINNQPVHAVTLQGPGDAPLQWKLRLHQPAQVGLARDRMAAAQTVYVIYDRAKPTRALLPEILL